MMVFGGGLGIYCFDLVAANSLSIAMHYDALDSYGWISVTPFFGGLVFFTLIIIGIKNQRLQVVTSHWLFLTVCVIFTGALLSQSWPHNGHFGGMQLALFFATVQLSASQTKMVRNQTQFEIFNTWTTLVLLSLLPFIVFGVYVYPHTRTAFGGGEPTEAEITLGTSAFCECSCQNH